MHEAPHHATPPFRDALRALLPGLDAPAEAHLDAFRGLADLLLRRATWWMGGAPHRITEVEFYWSGPRHEDPFAHGDPMQREFARWYFHRTGEGYRGGTYKGLDITLGAPDVAAGILVRGVERLDGDRAFVDGPCKCVDRLLALTHAPSVAALASSFDRSVDAPSSGASPSFLVLRDAPRAVPGVFESPRVGLTLKRGATDARLRFLAAPYRFLSEPARIKKGRVHLIASLHRQGISRDAIAQVTGSSATQVARCAAQYDLGRGVDPRALAHPADRDALCRLFGACDAFAGAAIAGPRAAPGVV